MLSATYLRFTAMALAFGLSSTVYAAESFVATITTLEGQTVRLQAPDSLPAWAQPGAAVRALGWESRIVSTADQTLTLDVEPTRLLRFKTGNEVTITEVDGPEVQACS